jgi:hypothetical protein
MRKPMKCRIPIAMFAFLAIATVACALSGAPSPSQIQTVVAATLTAAGEIATSVANTLAPISATPAATAVAASQIPAAEGQVTGRICYPSEGIPAMTAYFQDTQTNTVRRLPISQNQSSYEMTLPPGTYIAYAWLPDFSLGGAYSRAVPCGLGVDCTDHSLLTFEVVSSDSTDGIDICDWYSRPGDVPMPPGVTTPALTTNAPPTSGPTPMATSPSAPQPTSNLPGRISGSLTYPGSSMPPIVVVAFNLDTHYWWWVGTASGQSSYSIDNIPAGRYHVVAYGSGDLAGGYTAAVPCGLTAACSDHSLLTIQVLPGETTQGVNPGDWYAPSGTFPPKPGGINYP